MGHTLIFHLSSHGQRQTSYWPSSFPSPSCSSQGISSTPLGLEQNSAPTPTQSSTPAIPHSDSLALPIAISGNTSYARRGGGKLARMRTTLPALSRASRRLALGAEYGKRLDALAEATWVNERVVEYIVRLARECAHERSGESTGRRWK